MFIYNQTRSSVTVIDNRFIDIFMAEASGEFVKMYLYLLRLSQDPGRDFGITELADGLNHTEKDILRALRYWEKQGVLSLELSSEGSVMGVRILPVREEGDIPVTAAGKPLLDKDAEETAASPEQNSEAILPQTGTEGGSYQMRPRAKVEEIPMEAIAELQSQEDFRELIMVSEAYLGRTLSPKDIKLFAYLYDELHFPKDLLEYLVEYCVEGGHRSYRYMETVALNWHQEGKLTVELAKESARAYSRENKVVMKAFGISGRMLNNEERDYVEKWTKAYAMSLDLVEEACNITMASIQKASFQYADKILSDWHDAGIRSLDEARKHRENRKTSRSSRNEDSGKRQEVHDNNQGKNRFQNYQQRNIDYDALIQQSGWNPYETEE